MQQQQVTNSLCDDDGQPGRPHASKTRLKPYGAIRAPHRLDAMASRSGIEAGQSAEVQSGTECGQNAKLLLGLLKQSLSRLNILGVHH